MDRDWGQASSVTEEIGLGHLALLNTHYERLVLARGICCFTHSGKKQIPRGLKSDRDDNSFRGSAVFPHLALAPNIGGSTLFLRVLP